MTMQGTPLFSDVREIRDTGRELGRARGTNEGATLLVIGALHGNETAGLVAARRVLDKMARGARGERENALVLDAGELVALGGNLGAMREGRRYRYRDMNRVWSQARIDDLKARAQKTPSALDAEDVEQLDLLAAIEAEIARAKGRGSPVYLVDLHTTSAKGIPFVIFGDTLAQRTFVQHLPVPLILGLEEQLDGVLSSFASRLGCTTFAMEGGQHVDPGSIDNLEAVILLAAAAAGMFASPDLPALQEARALLDAKREGLPRIMEVLHRHAITEEDDFVMEPGFRNLDRVRAGQKLGRDRRGPILAPHDGVVMLPLYQGQGSDGFFWGREVSDRLLRATTALRRLGLDRYLDRLPGIERDRAHPTRFVVDASVAKIYPRSVYHWLGYRRIREEHRSLTIERSVDA